jgi:hypothetical protein
MNFALNEMSKITKTFVFLGKGMVRPGGFELPTFWFVATGAKILSRFGGVTYGPKPLFFEPSIEPKLNLNASSSI